MEKQATYTIMASSHPCKRQWVAWASMGVSVVALVVACVVVAVVNDQGSRIDHLEGKLIEMQTHVADILQFTIANHEYLYPDDAEYDDEDEELEGPSEGITVRRVLRRRREVDAEENEVSDSSQVPIFDRAYGINLKKTTAKRLRLYDSLLDNEEEEEDQSQTEAAPEVTESPIKPHHRTVVRRVDSEGGQANALAENLFHNSAAPPRSRLTQRRSRTKSLHGSRRGPNRQQNQRSKTNKAPGSVMFRSSFVKATSRHDGFTSPNSVVPPVSGGLGGAPRVVEQEPARAPPAALTRRPTSSSAFFGKRRKPRNKHHRRRRRTRPTITLAHFGASLRNTTTQHGFQDAGEHLDWKPAAWMDKLGLDSKYNLDQGRVTVREAGLYYLYAQVLYESGRSGAGFQIVVDDIPLLECLVPALRPAPTCHTGGLSYLPRNAEVRVRDLDTNLSTVKRHHNTFFGLVKLMDAPFTAEEMLLA